MPANRKAKVAYLCCSWSDFNNFSVYSRVFKVSELIELVFKMIVHQGHSNKANLRDLIAATGLVILLKFDPIHRFFSLCDLEIWCMTLKNNTTPLLYYIKLCVSFQIHRWIQTKVTVRKCSIRVKIGDFLSCVTLKFDGWPCKTIGHLLYTTSSFVHHFIPIGDFKFQLQSGNAQFGSKFCTAFRSHWWIQAGVTVRKRPIWVKYNDF